MQVGYGTPGGGRDLEKNVAQAVWDFIGCPFRFALFDQKWLPYFGWTTLEEERTNAALPFLRGRLLDVGCGRNTLIILHGTGIGVDTFDWGGGGLVVEDSSNLPFADASFDTVTFLASLNHIPYREKALAEGRRLLKPGGRLIISMIDPILGVIGHAIWWYSEEKHRGGMAEGETGGLWMKDIVRMCGDAGFSLKTHKRFCYGLNNIYVFELCGAAR